MKSSINVAHIKHQPPGFEYEATYLPISTEPYRYISANGATKKQALTALKPILVELHSDLGILIEGIK